MWFDNTDSLLYRCFLLVAAHLLPPALPLPLATGPGQQPARSWRCPARLSLCLWDSPSFEVIDESGPINRRNPVWGTGRRAWEALTLAAINRALRFPRDDREPPVAAFFGWPRVFNLAKIHWAVRPAPLC